MKVTVRIGLVLGLCVLTAALPAAAACGGTDLRSFTGYNYYTGSNGVQADLIGNFWQIGNFALANNGTWEAPNWIADFGGWYPSGGWQGDAGIIGCPSPVGAVVKMAFVISAPDAGSGAVFGAGCDASDAGSTNFEFGTAGSGGPVAMQPVPKATVTNSVKAPGQVSVTLSSPVLPGGVVDEAACGLAPTGYRVYTQTVARDGAAPTDRRRVAGGWVAGGAVTPIGQSASVTVPCVGSQDVYLAYSVVFTDGVETGHVGTNSTVVQCGVTSADQPTDFKIIKKPIRKPTGAQ